MSQPASNVNIKDPHVFRYIVKGFEPITGRVLYESRRDQIEADKTYERFISQGLEAWIFVVVLERGTTRVGMGGLNEV